MAYLVLTLSILPVYFRGFPAKKIWQQEWKPFYSFLLFIIMIENNSGPNAKLYRQWMSKWQWQKKFHSFNNVLWLPDRIPIYILDQDLGWHIFSHSTGPGPPLSPISFYLQERRKKARELISAIILNILTIKTLDPPPPAKMAAKICGKGGPTLFPTASWGLSVALTLLFLKCFLRLLGWISVKSYCNENQNRWNGFPIFGFLNIMICKM